MTCKLVANLFYSLDGDNILGRVTYDEWKGYWPSMTEGKDVTFADFINGTPKHVASTTLTENDLTWANSQLITGDLLDHLRALKETEGKDIAAQGSLSVTRQLVQAGLMDELTLIVHPAIAGTGRRLFDGAEPTRLNLVDVQRTDKGNVR